MILKRERIFLIYYTLIEEFNLKISIYFFSYLLIEHAELMTKILVATLTYNGDQ